MVLFVLYLLRIAAIAVYILCGFFTDNYVLSVSSAKLQTFRVLMLCLDRRRGCAASDGFLELQGTCRIACGLNTTTQTQFNRMSLVVVSLGSVSGTKSTKMERVTGCLRVVT